jgi:3-keto-5-aminohexanoate cleavage enzyme
VSQDKAVITCALTGVLTDPNRFPVPVTPAQMAAAAKEAFDAGATIMHTHVRNQQPGLGYLPSWDPDDSDAVCAAIREACPGVVINLSTGVMGDDIEGPLACLDRVRPEMAALNAGTLNYLKVTRGGTWAWPPLVFANPVEKVEAFARFMAERGILGECECFDTGILRSVDLYRQVGLLKPPIDVSLIMGVASGMPAKPAWLPLLIDELPAGATWQVIGIGRSEVWDLHRRAAELGGNLRTGLEDTFYLPDGSKAPSNGALIEQLATIAREAGREIASPAETRELFHMPAP